MREDIKRGINRLLIRFGRKKVWKIKCKKEVQFHSSIPGTGVWTEHSKYPPTVMFQSQEVEKVEHKVWISHLHEFMYVVLTLKRHY